MRKIIMASITAVVVIAVLAGTLIPVLDDATATEDSFTNEGLWRMKAIENGDTWVKSSGTWTYNDTDAMTYGDYGTYSTVLGDDWSIRANGTARGSFVRGTSSSATVVSADDVITISGTGITSSGTTTISGYGYSSTGDYVMTNPSVAPYVNSDTEIYGTGWTDISGTSGVVCHIEGSIDDGVTVTAYDPYGATAFDSITVSDISINKTEVDGYEDLYQITSITFTVTAPLTVDETTTTYTQDITYSAYVVPVEVTAERSVHFTDGENAILSAIPVIIIVALLLAVVAIVLRSRMD